MKFLKLFESFDLYLKDLEKFIETKDMSVFMHYNFVDFYLMFDATIRDDWRKLIPFLIYHINLDGYINKLMILDLIFKTSNHLIKTFILTLLKLNNKTFYMYLSSRIAIDGIFGSFLEMRQNIEKKYSIDLSHLNTYDELVNFIKKTKSLKIRLFEHIKTDEKIDFLEIYNDYLKEKAANNFNI